jgi:hypothetical protein
VDSFIVATVLLLLTLVIALVAFARRFGVLDSRSGIASRVRPPRTDGCNRAETQDHRLSPAATAIDERACSPQRKLADADQFTVLAIGRRRRSVLHLGRRLKCYNSSPCRS